MHFGSNWFSLGPALFFSRAKKIPTAIRRRSRPFGTRPFADEWVTQLLRQGDAKVFKKYSQMKLQMKREALA
jgi:hypothetical protein